MDPFLTLLHSFSSSLSAAELRELKFLCQDKIGKRKLESVQSGTELFNFLLEQQVISSHDVDFLKTMLKVIKREDLVTRLEHFVEEGEANVPEDQPDVNEKRRWIFLLFFFIFSKIIAISTYTSSRHGSAWSTVACCG